MCLGCLVCLQLCKEAGSSPLSLQLLRGGIWACMRCPLSMSLLGFGMWTMLANFHMCGIMLVLRAVFEHAREECESKKDYVFQLPDV